MDYRERWEHKDFLIGKTLERRIRVFHLGLTSITVVFLLNLWYLQGVRGDAYAALAENNRLRRLPIQATRGVIFDRESAVIAASRPSLDLVLLREGARDVEAQLTRLVPILGVPRAALEERLRSRRGLPYEPQVLWEDLSLEQLARIESRRELFPAIQVQQHPRRSYPQGPLFAHVVGYVGEVGEGELGPQSRLRPGDIVGKFGIEKTYDEMLRGHRGWNLVTVNNLGLRIGEEWVGEVPQHGSRVNSTLDLRLQRELLEGLGSEVGSGVFLDPSTGEVLALVSTPTFDPNLFADGISPENWQSILHDAKRPMLDRTVNSAYAPGSTFKVLVAIAGLESGATKSDETVYCNGSTKLYGAKRLCWKRGGHGWVNLRKALTVSCNVYFYHLGKRLGIDTIERYGAMFGLGERSGIDLPSEATGILPSRRWKQEQRGSPWYPGDTISVAIGQGYLAVTPMQMARAVSAVATGGRLPQPHLFLAEPREPRRLEISPSTFELVRQAMRDAVKDGTGRNAALDAIEVAGKTGTAQVFVHSAGIDADDLPKAERDHGWFVGYAPAERPRIAFAVVVEHGGHGGSSAAIVVRRVLAEFFADADEAPRVEGPRTHAPPAG